MYSYNHISYFIKISAVILSLVVPIESFLIPSRSHPFSNISANFCSFKLVCVLLMDSQFCTMSFITVYLLSSSDITVFTSWFDVPGLHIAVQRRYRVRYRLPHRRDSGGHGDKHFVEKLYNRWFKIEHYNFLLHK